MFNGGGNYQWQGEIDRILATAVKLTANATSPRAMWVRRFDVKPVGHAAMIMKPTANAPERPATSTRPYAAIGSNTKWQMTPANSAPAGALCGYRPQLSAKLRAVLDPNGQVLSWQNLYVRKNTEPDAAHIPYSVPHQSIRWVEDPSDRPTGPWRGVSHTQHTFYTESFIDELAYAAGKDPLQRPASISPRSPAGWSPATGA